ncbi:MAG: hypothetical protein GY711_13385 [bacterium]|nr:hypothetical protein [bacterium]
MKSLTGTSPRWPSLALLSALLSPTVGLAQIANEDDCSGAGLRVYEAGVLHTFDTENATTDPSHGQSTSCASPPSAPGIEHDVWFTFWPTVTGTARLAASTDDFTDLKVFVYACPPTNCNTPLPPPLRCSAPVAGPGLSNVVVVAIPIAAYQPIRVQLGSVPGTGGVGEGTFLFIETGSPPAAPTAPEFAAAQEPDFCDDLDSYAAGPLLSATDRWEPWDLDPNVGMAQVSPTVSLSPPHSMFLDEDDDLVHRLDLTSGKWVIRADMYVVMSVSGESFLILMNTYEPLGAKNWSTTLRANAVTGLIEDLDSAATLPFNFGEWGELRVEIDLDADTQSAYYNSQLLFTDSWTGHSGAVGTPTIEAIDLFSSASSGVFFDNVRITRQPCDGFDDYTAASELVGQTSRWESWNNDPAVDNALVVTSPDPAFNGSNSLLVDDTDDIVRRLSGANSGKWRASARWYIQDTGGQPFVGNSWMLLQNTYTPNGPVHWSSQIRASSATGMVEDFNSGGAVPMVTNAWRELRVDIDLDNDTQSAYYNNQLLYTDAWTTHVAAGGVPELASLNLFADGPGGNTGAFFDEVCVRRAPCSQNADNVSIVPNPLNSCPGSLNRYFRVYDLDSECGIVPGADAYVESVDFAVRSALSPMPGHVRLYSRNPQDPLPFDLGSLTLLHEESITVGNLSFEHVYVPLCEAVRVPFGRELVVEVAVDQAGSQFMIGVNGTGTKPWYFAGSGGCAPIPQEVPTGLGIDPIIDVTVYENPPLGFVEASCVPDINGTGLPGRIHLEGSGIADEPLFATCFQGPPGEFGYYIFSDNLGTIPIGNGVVCVFTTILRYNRPDLVFQFDANGVGVRASTGMPVELPTDGSYPFNSPLGGVAPGETWYYQGWYRECQTWNYTDLVGVTFR